MCRHGRNYKTVNHKWRFNVILHFLISILIKNLMTLTYISKVRRKVRQLKPIFLLCMMCNLSAIYKKTGFLKSTWSRSFFWVWRKHNHKWNLTNRFWLQNYWNWKKTFKHSFLSFTVKKIVLSFPKVGQSEDKITYRKRC